MENVASMTPTDRDEITKLLTPVDFHRPLSFDAASLGPIHRPGYYWLTFDLKPSQFAIEEKEGYAKVWNREPVKVTAEQFLEEGASKGSSKTFPTAVKWLPRQQRPSAPAGIEDCDEETIKKWESTGYAMAPYQFK